DGGRRRGADHVAGGTPGGGGEREDGPLVRLGDGVVARGEGDGGRGAAGGDGHGAGEEVIIGAVVGRARHLVGDGQRRGGRPGAADEELADVAARLGRRRVGGRDADDGRVVVVDGDGGGGGSRGDDIAGPGVPQAQHGRLVRL